MKCEKCPLYHEPDSYDSDKLYGCDLFGCEWNNQFQYGEDEVIGCYIDRHYIQEYANVGEWNNRRIKLFVESLPIAPIFSPEFKHYVCPKCSLVLDEGRDNYCPSCGKKIKWDEGGIDVY